MNKSLRDILEYWITFLLILSVAAIWQLVLDSQGNLYKIITIFSLGTYIIIYLKKINVKFVQNYMIYGCLLIILILLGTKNLMLSNLTFVFIPIMMLILFIYILYRDGRILSFIKQMSNLICFMAVVSLIIYVFGCLMNIFPKQQFSFLWNNSIKNCYTYLGLQFETQSINFLGNRIVKNTGIYAEAPGYAIILTLAFFYQYFFEHCKRKKILLFITLLTTFSSKGYMLFVIIIFCGYFFTKPIRKDGKVLKTIVIPFLLFIVICAINIILDLKMSSDVESYSVRLDDIFACYKTWLTNIWFGVGINRLVEIKENMQSFRWGNQGISTGFFLILAQGGISLFILFVVPILFMFKNVEKNYKACAMAFAIIYLALILMSNMTYSFINLFILSLSMVLLFTNAQKKRVVLL